MNLSDPAIQAKAKEARRLAAEARKAARITSQEGSGDSSQGITGKFSPIGAIRANCLDCCEGPKSIIWCTCDGTHSTRCHLWPYRFGSRPETIAQKYGPALVTPTMMPDAYVEEDDLPNGMEAAAAYLTDLASRKEVACV